MIRPNDLVKLRIDFSRLLSVEGPVRLVHGILRVIDAKKAGFNAVTNTPRITLLIEDKVGHRFYIDAKDVAFIRRPKAKTKAAQRAARVKEIQKMSMKNKIALLSKLMEKVDAQ